MPAPAIPPEMRARLRDLQLGSRRTAAGSGIGQHASRNRGAGLEFAQYRGYEPGDEPRRVDWKLYARSDRWFVRESERESPLTAWVLLDATASMRQSDHAQPDWRKFDAARLAAACVFEIALRQGDAFGLATIGAEPRVVPVATGVRQRDRCLLALGDTEPAGAWPATDALRRLHERIAPQALVLVLSDFFDDAAVDLAWRLAATGRDTRAIQFLSHDERVFPFRGPHRFVDPESGAQRRVDAGAARRAFLQRFGAARTALASGFAARGIGFSTAWLDEPADAPLWALFGRGAGLRHGAESPR